MDSIYCILQLIKLYPVAGVFSTSAHQRSSLVSRITFFFSIIFSYSLLKSYKP